MPKLLHDAIREAILVIPQTNPQPTLERVPEQQHRTMTLS